MRESPRLTRSWRRRLALVTAGALAALSGPLTCGAAAASPPSGQTPARWAIQASPNEPHEPASELSGVACQVDGACMAVGYYTTRTGEPRHQYSLTERRVGSRWSLVPTPSVPGASATTLDGVSCPAADRCIAVGFAVLPHYAGVDKALTEEWNGTTWTVLPAPLPPGRDPLVTLSAVSCPVRTFCLAVGGYVSSLAAGAEEQPLAYAWNGTAWSVLRAPNPRAENGSAFTSVDCVSADRCEVDADYAYADIAQSVLAYGFSAGTWSKQRQVNPAGQESNSDDGVACISVASCESAGTWTPEDPGVPAGLAEQWSGGRWIRQELPAPKGSQTDTLDGVACTDTGVCTAVGGSSQNRYGGRDQTLAVFWNGASWTLLTTPDRSRTSDTLNAVTCVSSSTCVAVGEATTDTAGYTLVEVSSA
jgi:hypothetical protein